MLERNLRAFGHMWINGVVIAVTAAALVDPTLRMPIGTAALALTLLLTPGVGALVWADRHGRVLTRSRPTLP